MDYLKEDGSPDVERINKLPLEEYMKVMGSLTEGQIKEYNSKLPINESVEPIQPMETAYTLEEAIQSGRVVDAEELINRLKRECKGH